MGKQAYASNWALPAVSVEQECKWLPQRSSCLATKTKYFRRITDGIMLPQAITDSPAHLHHENVQKAA